MDRSFVTVSNDLSIRHARTNAAAAIYTAKRVSQLVRTFVLIYWYNWPMARGTSALPGPTAQARPGSGCARGEVVE